jgi:enamine deaminase RidA (YjgF/YER057c/UK114 family)
MAKIERSCAGKRGPASTPVAVAALAHPDWLIEVEAIAVV